jgi:hypothetical protein
VKVGEPDRRSGPTVRAPLLDDEIGLLKPSQRSAAGDRPHDRADIARLHAIQSLPSLGVPRRPIGGVALGVTVLRTIGALGGFVQALTLSWIRQRVEPAMVGRATGPFMFRFVRLAALSGAAPGRCCAGRGRRSRRPPGQRP